MIAATPTPAQVPITPFYLGCAVWSFAGWEGHFYPAHSRSQNYLSLYGQRLRTVEGNTTFYAVPDTATLTRWGTEVPDGFQFCLKFPKTVTHLGALYPRLAKALAFLEQVSCLGDHLGPTFLQLPPQYGPQQWPDLQRFLETMPSDRYRIALEVRHPDWFQLDQAKVLNQLLTNQGLGRVLLDTRPIYNCPDNPQQNSQRRKPKLPLQPLLTSDFTLVRLISHPHAQWNQPYLSQWVETIRQWLSQRKQIYYFVHCPQEERSPHTAWAFQEQLEQAGVPVPALPWQQLVPEPQQLSLF